MSTKTNNINATSLIREPVVEISNVTDYRDIALAICTVERYISDGSMNKAYDILMSMAHCFSKVVPMLGRINRYSPENTSPLSIAGRMLIAPTDLAGEFADLIYCDYPLDSVAGKRAALAARKGCYAMLTRYLKTHPSIGWEKIKNGVVIATATGCAVVTDTTATLKAPGHDIPKGNMLAPTVFVHDDEEWFAWLCLIFICAFAR